MTRLTWITLSVALGVAAPGCGDESACAKLGNLTCDKACDCSGDGMCRFASGGGTATITFPSKSDCKGFLVTLSCGGDEDPVVDPEGCIADVEAAGCIATTEGMALDYPDSPACEDPPPP